MLFILQLMAKKKISHSTNNGNIYTAEHLKIHPVDAESETEAVAKVTAYYENNKAGWKIRLIDIEGLII